MASPTRTRPDCRTRTGTGCWTCSPTRTATGIVDLVDADDTGGPDADGDGIDDSADIDWAEPALASDEDGDGITDSADTDPDGDGLVGPFGDDSRYSLPLAVRQLAARVRRRAADGIGPGRRSGEGAARSPRPAMRAIRCRCCWRSVALAALARRRRHAVLAPASLFVAAGFVCLLPGTGVGRRRTRGAVCRERASTARSASAAVVSIRTPSGPVWSWRAAPAWPSRPGSASTSRDAWEPRCTSPRSARQDSTTAARWVIESSAPACWCTAGRERRTPRRGQWSAFGRLGVGAMSNDSSENLDYETDHAVHVLFGIGVDHALTERLGLRLETLVFDADAQLVQLGVTYRVGARKRRPREIEPVVEVSPVRPSAAVPVDADTTGLEPAAAMPAARMPTSTRKRTKRADCPTIGVVLEAVAFESGSTSLDAGSRVALDALIESLRGSERTRVRLDAYTDGVGGAAENLVLSQAASRRDSPSTWSGAESTPAASRRSVAARPFRSATTGPRRAARAIAGSRSRGSIPRPEPDPSTLRDLA